MKKAGKQNTREDQIIKPYYWRTRQTFKQNENVLVFFCTFFLSYSLSPVSHSTALHFLSSCKTACWTICCSQQLPSRTWTRVPVPLLCWQNSRVAAGRNIFCLRHGVLDNPAGPREPQAKSPDWGPRVGQELNIHKRRKRKQRKGWQSSEAWGKKKGKHQVWVFFVFFGNTLVWFITH